MPSHEGPRKGTSVYDPAECEAWLIQTGRATRRAKITEPTRDTIFTRDVDLANALGVNERTVNRWHQLEDFKWPRDAMPFGEIKDWHELRKLNTNQYTKDENAATLADGKPIQTRMVGKSGRDRQQEARAVLLEMDIEERRGALLPLDEQIDFYTRTVKAAQAYLSEVPAAAMGSLPVDTPEDVKRVVYQTVETYVNNFFNMMAELLDGDKDDQELSESD